MSYEDDLNIPDEKLAEYLSSVSEINSISETLNDPEVDQTLGYVVSLIARPDIPAKIATPLITKLQAMSFRFKMQAKDYMLVKKGGPDASMKKNLYMSLSEETEKLVQALKYTTRNV